MWWNALRESLKGKKSYLISIWAGMGALYMWMNGIGEAEQTAILATVAALGASLKAGIVRQNGVAILLVGASASLFFLASGCATLGAIDPATGTSAAQDLVTASGELASLFGPMAGTIIPVGLGAILSMIITMGKVKDASAPG